MSEDPFSYLNRHIEVSRETFERLDAYRELLIKWQKKINLVGTDTIQDSWRRHFLDSLQLISHLPSSSGPIMDMGTGAGFPGMALAIYGIKNIHLIESDGKKITFLREVARQCKASVTLHHGRIEKIENLQASVILARAVASLDDLLSLSLPYVSHETICLFHKGKNYFKEIEDASKNWVFEHTITPSVTEPQGTILKLSQIKRRNL